MKTTLAIALALGTSTVAGCSTNGVSLSESKFIDNNCSGNGWVTNET
ncbi:MAG TPA: hypothetical protein PLR41_15770 [Alphaproteobacteria bacterium]|nr:hypothetical protein [Alphaproteobacteria bacterium]